MNRKISKFILEKIYHYSTYLTSWSWQKLYGNKENGYGLWKVAIKENNIMAIPDFQTLMRPLLELEKTGV